MTSVGEILQKHQPHQYCDYWVVHASSRPTPLPPQMTAGARSSRIRPLLRPTSGFGSAVRVRCTRPSSGLAPHPGRRPLSGGRGACRTRPCRPRMPRQRPGRCASCAPPPPQRSGVAAVASRFRLASGQDVVADLPTAHSLGMQRRTARLPGGPMTGSEGTPHPSGRGTR